MEKLKGDTTKEEGMSTRCWKKFCEESLFARYSPFLVSLAAGDLAPKDFRCCISEDLRFLKAFVEAYQSAMNCANDDAEKKAIRSLSDSVREKIKAYDKIVQGWRFTLLKNSKYYATTDEYTKFLRGTASREVDVKLEGPNCKRKVAPVYTLAAIAPSMRLYSHLCHQMQKILDASDATNIYNSWIHYYCSRAFEDSVRKIEENLDELGKSFGGNKRVEAEIEKIYDKAMKLRVKFFAKMPMDRQTYYPLSQSKDLGNRQLIIFCEFNMICSTNDIASMLEQARIGRSNPAEWKQQVNSLFSNVEQYSRCIGCGKIGEKITAAEELDLAGLDGALEKVAAYAEGDIDGAERWGLFTGIRVQVVKDIARTFELQDDCKSFFQKFLKKGGPNINLHIISRHWFGHLIRSILSVLSPGTNLDSNVHTNELDCNSEFVTTGSIVRKVLSPYDKLKSFLDVVFSSGAEIGHFAVYIGGDVDDLLCLLKADIGIVISSRSSKSLEKFANRFGVKFVPLFTGILVKKQKELAQGRPYDWNLHPGILYTVSSWAEIEAFIFGL